MHDLPWLFRDPACLFFIAAVAAAILAWASFRSNRTISNDISAWQFQRHSVWGLLRYVFVGFFGVVMVLAACVALIIALILLIYGIISP